MFQTYRQQRQRGKSPREAARAARVPGGPACGEASIETVEALCEPLYALTQIRARLLDLSRELGLRSDLRQKLIGAHKLAETVMGRYGAA